MIPNPDRAARARALWERLDDSEQDEHVPMILAALETEAREAEQAIVSTFNRNRHDDEGAAETWHGIYQEVRDALATAEQALAVEREKHDEEAYNDMKAANEKAEQARDDWRLSFETSNEHVGKLESALTRAGVALKEIVDYVQHPNYRAGVRLTAQAVLADIAALTTPSTAGPSNPLVAPVAGGSRVVPSGGDSGQ